MWPKRPTASDNIGESGEVSSVSRADQNVTSVL